MDLTNFTQILGNEEIKKQLSCMLVKRAVGHSFLFAGPDGIGKSLFAWALAARLIAEYGACEEQQHKIQTGQHPDIHIYRPEGKLGLHSIQALRQLSDEVHLPPYEAPWKVFIIHDADRMLSYSANALLKTFEEPPPRTLIILLSHSQATLIPTIVSRCRTLHFQPLSLSIIEAVLKERYALDELTCSRIARQSEGSLGKAERLASKEGDALRSYLLNFLAQGPLMSYRAMQEVVQVLSEQAESLKKQKEESIKEELCKIPLDQLSAQQQQAFEKEFEGFAALASVQEAQAIFKSILSWYRDVQLLLMGGNRGDLMNLTFMMKSNKLCSGAILNL